MFHFHSHVYFLFSIEDHERACVAVGLVKGRVEDRKEACGGRIRQRS
jgi:hypothetical protein